MNISNNGLNLIKKYEGCVLHAYKDVGGNPTIGWGMTFYPTNGARVTMLDNPLTQLQADTMFVLIVEPFCEGVLKLVPNVTQNQLDALTSFAYNCGLGAFSTSTLCKHVQENCVVQTDFTAYCHVAGQVNQGLYNRRLEEYNLYSKVETLQTITNKNSMKKIYEISKIETTVTYNRYDTDDNGVVIPETEQSSGTFTIEGVTTMADITAKAQASLDPSQNIEVVAKDGVAVGEIK